MLSALKRIVAPIASEPDPEHVFPLDERRKTLLLLDLKAILRRPGARLALPNLANLELTIERNARRVRVPHNAMLVIVRELLAVRKRIPPKSPLLEIMHAVPGLSHTILTMPLPISRIIEDRPAGSRIPPVVDVDAEAAQIRAMIARRGRPAAPPPPDPGLPVSAPRAAAAGPIAAARDLAPLAFARESPAPRPADGGAEATPPAPPAPASPTLTANSANMTALDQRNFLAKSVESFEAVALRTHEMADGDLSAYVELCVLHNDHARAVEVLEERVAHAPCAWAYARLLDLAEASLHPRLDAIAAGFRAWVDDAHPDLVAGPAGQSDGETLCGVRRAALKRIATEELEAAPA
jgi:hypothetical protein